MNSAEGNHHVYNKEEKRIETVEYRGKEFEVERKIEEDNFRIFFLKQDKIEDNLEGLYQSIGELLYRHAKEA